MAIREHARRIDDAALDGLRMGFRGGLLRPGDAGYDEARRVYNGMVDRYPALIARCTGTADVVAALRFARANDLVIAVRGGGHGIVGFAVCDDGIVIDLSEMKGVRVDPVARTAWAQGGVTWGDFNHETQLYGLATTGGFVSTTGIAGLTLGGGIGLLQGRYGLTCDNLIGAEVVLADGRVVRASEQENEDLFWGLRGGGGNFGIVTAFEYRLHPVTDVGVGLIFYPLERARDVVEHYRSVVERLAPDLLAAVAFMNAPPMDPMPPAVQGKQVCALFVAAPEPFAPYRSDLDLLRQVGEPLGELLMDLPYAVANTIQDHDMPWGGFYYWKSTHVDELVDDAVEMIVSSASEPLVGLTQALLFRIGGAVAAVPEDATAFPLRSGWMWQTDAGALDRDDAERATEWARRSHRDLAPWATGAGYVNFTTYDGDEQVRATYGKARYDRLVEIKRTYDPENVFRLNQNIKP